MIIQKEFQRYLKFTLFKYTLGFGAYKDSQENNRIIQQTGGLFIQQISTYKYVYIHQYDWCTQAHIFKTDGIYKGILAMCLMHYLSI